VTLGLGCLCSIQAELQEHSFKKTNKFKKCMLVIKLLGILDIFVGICFWIFEVFNLIPGSFILILGLFLLAKGLIFITGFSAASSLDIICSIILIATSSTAMPKVIVIIVSLFLIQKGIFSLLS
jgi:hypothetical protein